jgi:tetratricopeptide (TPR) repeat protein
MSAHDSWFRKTSWSAADATEFERRLARSRTQKAQYLHIQAGHLAETGKARLAAPAIELASRCLSEDRHRFFETSAHLTIAEANGTLGRRDEALKAYRAAVSAEAKTRGMRCCAYLSYAWFVVTHGLAAEFGNVLKAMESMEDGDLVFPIAQYKFFASLALISQELGDSDNAQRMARNALKAESSAAPFARHREVGIVKNIDKSIQKRIRQIAA